MPEIKTGFLFALAPKVEVVVLGHVRLKDLEGAPENSASVYRCLRATFFTVS